MSTDPDSQVVISVVVPVKNGLPWLHEQMKALLEQKCSRPWEVIVADNASSDGSVQVVQDLADHNERLRLVDASSVVGPAATRNVGSRFARGDILAFCDADDVIHPGWLESWLPALAESDLAGGLMDYWTLNDVPTPSPAVPRPPPAAHQFGFLDAACSGNMAVRRQAFESVGGFDEDLAVGEDTDLSWRMQLAGFRLTIGEGVISRRERSGTSVLLRRSTQFGRCGPRLYQRYRDAGLRRDPMGAVESWLYLVVTIPRLFDAQFRLTWIRLLGWRVGRLVESCRRLVFYP